MTRTSRYPFNTDFRDYYDKFRMRTPLNAKDERRLLFVIKGLPDPQKKAVLDDLWPEKRNGKKKNLVDELWPDATFNYLMAAFGNNGNGRPTALERKSAIDKFVLHNMRLVLSRVLRYRSQNDPLVMEIISYGTDGLYRAIELFDLGRNVRFSTYAVHWIDSCIGKGIEFLEGRRSPAVRKLNREFAKTQKEMTEEMGFRPSVERVAEKLDWSAQTFHTYQTMGISSLSTASDEADAMDPPAHDPPTPEETVRKELYNALHASIGILDPYEEDIIRRHFGLGYEEETLQNLADTFGVTKERIRQIENGGLHKLYMKLRRFRETD